jgi:hypothetical protein
MDMRTVLSSWYRFSHDTTGLQPANSSELVSWTYDKGGILSTINSVTYLGFISPTPYTDFVLDVDISSDNSDDDAVTVVLGFVKDSGGVEHTLSLVRQANSQSNSLPISGISWALVYDFKQTTQVVFVDKTSTVTDAVNWGSNGVHIHVERVGSVFTAYTSQLSPTILDIDEATKIEFDTSSDPRTTVFDGNLRVGVGACSQQEALFKNLVIRPESFLYYDMRTASVMEYDTQSGTSVATPDTLETVVGVGRFINDAFSSRTYYVTPSLTLLPISKSPRDILEDYETLVVAPGHGLSSCMPLTYGASGYMPADNTDATTASVVAFVSKVISPDVFVASHASRIITNADVSLALTPYTTYYVGTGGSLVRNNEVPANSYLSPCAFALSENSFVTMLSFAPSLVT